MIVKKIKYLLRNKRTVFYVAVVTIVICCSIFDAYANSIDTQVEQELLHKQQLQMASKKQQKANIIKAQPKKISKKQKQLAYWCKVTGEKIIDVTEIEATLTFYTSLNCENGYGPITCTGAKLQEGIVANNMDSLGTSIHFENFGTYTVADRGGDNFNTYTNFD